MIRLVTFDLDGVVYTEEDILPYAVETLQDLRNAGRSIRFFTNNSTKTREAYTQKLARMGIESHLDEIMTSAVIARAYLQSKSPEGAKIFVIGETGLFDELACFDIMPPERAGEAAFVVVGYDREFTYQKMSHALDALLAGAELVATNRDATFPGPGGKILPGGGTMVAALECMWGRSPFVCGKPNPYGLHQLMDTAGVTSRETILVGDRAETDMLTGKRAGVRTCLVLTGITTSDSVRSIPPECWPDHIISTLRELPALLEKIDSEHSQNGNRKGSQP